VGRLIGKIETDGNQQKQEYSKEMQPINKHNNGNNSLVKIYADGTKKEDKKPDETPETKAESIINNYGRSAAEDFGIQTAAGAAGIWGVRGCL
jgi:YD repeat-containing protein